MAQDKKYAEQEKGLEAQNAEVDQKTAGLRSRRAEMGKGIEKPLLARYEQVFKRRDGIAIVEVRGEVCQGCDMGVPPQIANFARDDRSTPKSSGSRAQSWVKR